jgi:hypothetical protein
VPSKYDAQLEKLLVQKKGMYNYTIFPNLNFLMPFKLIAKKITRWERFDFNINK